MIDLWCGEATFPEGRGGTPTLAESAGQLADPAAFGVLVDLGGIQGSTPSICLASAGLPGVTAKIAGICRGQSRKPTTIISTSNKPNPARMRKKAASVASRP